MSGWWFGRLGELGDAVDEVDRGAEVAEAELPLERVVHLAPAFGRRHAARIRTVDRRRTHGRLFARSRKPTPRRTSTPASYASSGRSRTSSCSRCCRSACRRRPSCSPPQRRASRPRSSWRAGICVAAALLLQLKTVLDNADGQLARAAGKESVLGRYLDSESDLLVNAALFAALGHVTGRPLARARLVLRR